MRDLRVPAVGLEPITKSHKMPMFSMFLNILTIKIDKFNIAKNRAFVALHIKSMTQSMTRKEKQ